MRDSILEETKLERASNKPFVHSPSAMINRDLQVFIPDMTLEDANSAARIMEWDEEESDMEDGFAPGEEGFVLVEAGGSTDFVEW